MPLVMAGTETLSRSRARLFLRIAQRHQLLFISLLRTLIVNTLDQEATDQRMNTTCSNVTRVVIMEYRNIFSRGKSKKRKTDVALIQYSFYSPPRTRCELQPLHLHLPGLVEIWKESSHALG